MYAILARAWLAAQIKEVLCDQPVLYKKTGTFSAEEFQQYCAAAANVPIQSLVVDRACCDSEEALIKGIRKFRVARSARVMLITPGSGPGDPTISALVGLGVYDIIAPAWPEASGDDEPEELDIRPHLAQQFKINYHLGHAARWYLGSAMTDEGPQEVPPPKPKLRKPFFEFEDGQDDELFHSLPPKVQVRERILGNVVIAVAGIDRRTGTTHTAISLAMRLQQLGNRVACLECADPLHHPLYFRLLPRDKPLENGKFTLKGVDFFPEATPKTLLATTGYAYLVLDLGSAWDADQETDAWRIMEYFRADLRIVTTTVSLSDFHRLANWLPQRQETFRLLVNLCTPSTYKRFTSGLSTTAKKEQIMLWHAGIFQPDLFAQLPAADQLRMQLLHEVLPSHQKQKKKGLSWKKSYR